MLHNYLIDLVIMMLNNVAAYKKIYTPLKIHWTKLIPHLASTLRKLHIFEHSNYDNSSEKRKRQINVRSRRGYQGSKPCFSKVSLREEAVAISLHGAKMFLGEPQFCLSAESFAGYRLVFSGNWWNYLSFWKSKVWKILDGH